MLVKRNPTHPTSERQHSRKSLHGARNNMDLGSIQSSRNSNSNSNTPAPIKLLQELLQACYQIDSTLCIATQTHPGEIVSWQSLDPYLYLTSPSLLKRWETDLELLSHQYLVGHYTPDTFEEKLASILPGVERFEDAKRMMELNFEDELENCGVDIVVPDAFWEAIEERCRIIDDAFKGLEKRLDEQNEVAASS
jgi:hypothetical protein